MSWRYLFITQRCKLDYGMGHIVIRLEDETTRLALDDIQTLVLESTEVSLTTALMAALLKRKTGILFCGEDHNPLGLTLPLYGCHDCSKKLRMQIAWSDEMKALAHQRIIGEKIRQQILLLEHLGRTPHVIEQMKGYAADLLPGDPQNREATAARVYFQELFGSSFKRNEATPVNAALNYGYTLILSLVSNTIVANGYNTQLGIFHASQHNPFNLSSDLMEPFRPIVDGMVYALAPTTFGPEEKNFMRDLLRRDIFIKGRTQRFDNAIDIYAKGVFDMLNNEDPDAFQTYAYEL